jgi:hypothetical protein
LSTCEEENYKLEKTIDSLNEQLEYYEKLKEKLDHTKGELLLTIEKLNKFEKMRSLAVKDLQMKRQD